MFNKPEQRPLPTWEFATSLDKACDVLSCCTTLKPAWGISELSRNLGIGEGKWLCEKAQERYFSDRKDL
jgi:hypothetical protein